MDKRIVTQEVIAGGGQPRPYADHIWKGYIVFSVPEGQLWASNWPTAPEQVKPFLDAFGVPSKAKDQSEWYSPWLEKLERVDGPENRWYYEARQYYLD